jgi:hypothetical protein
MEGKVLSLFNPAVHNYKSMLMDNFVTGPDRIFLIGFCIKICTKGEIVFSGTIFP